MTATSLDLSQIKTDALSAASTFRTLIGLGTLATQSPTGTPSASNFLRGDFSWQTIDLTGYVPYTGATANLDLGSYTFSAKNATIAGGTVTTSTPVLNLTQTFNNAAVTFSAFSINATDTASAVGSTLADWRVGGQEKFKVVAKGGSAVTRLELWSTYVGIPQLQWYAEAGSSSGYGGFVSCPGGFMESTTNSPGAFAYVSSVASSSYRQWEVSVSGNRMKFSQSTKLEWYGADYRADTNTSDLSIGRDAANTLAQRNGASAQTYRLYNTYSSATSYERGKLEWSSSVFRIGTEKGSGGGAATPIEFQTDGTTRLTISSTGVATLPNTLDLTIRTVTYGATMAIDAALGNKIAITLTGNGTISNPTNSVDGRVLVFRLRQDGSGNRVPVWDTKYSFVGDLATVTLSTVANKIDRVAFEYDSTDDKWYCISFIKGS